MHLPRLRGDCQNCGALRKFFANLGQINKDLHRSSRALTAEKNNQGARDCLPDNTVSSRAESIKWHWQLRRQSFDHRNRSSPSSGASPREAESQEQLRRSRQPFQTRCYLTRSWRKSTSRPSNWIKGRIKKNQPTGSVPLKPTLVLLSLGVQMNIKCSSSHLVKVLAVVPNFRMPVPLPKSHFHR